MTREQLVELLGGIVYEQKGRHFVGYYDNFDITEDLDLAVERINEHFTKGDQA